MKNYLNDSIFWIEVEKIQPNPYQPRRDFNEDALNDLADSIRQYGILQPLVVTRKEEEKEDGGIRVTYELIAGERRLRASKIAGIAQVPAVIRSAPEDPKAKLELAIIENLQREDLNPVDRARAFARLVEEFGFKHSEVAKKVGRSREYVSNTLRLLDLPEEVLVAVRQGKITEGHARTVMMLADRPDEQKVLFKEILYKKLSVREAEAIAREIAHDRVRKKKYVPDPEISALEGRLSNSLGTRVHIERRENGGKLVIDFFTKNDLEDILELIKSNKINGKDAFMERFIQSQAGAGKSEEKTEGMSEEMKTEEKSTPAFEERRYSYPNSSEVEPELKPWMHPEVSAEMPEESLPAVESPKSLSEHPQERHLEDLETLPMQMDEPMPQELQDISDQNLNQNIYPNPSSGSNPNVNLSPHNFDRFQTPPNFQAEEFRKDMPSQSQEKGTGIYGENIESHEQNVPEPVRSERQIQQEQNWNEDPEIEKQQKRNNGEDDDLYSVKNFTI
ncbi:MAG TPA: ParB/RepB/Spo0J family partition protein [Candidatus Paceibacterota bacterium]|nr:ParB/RepB/Spo0J family partition protein [Candidatus Paceibacterota bacterium]